MRYISREYLYKYQIYIYIFCTFNTVQYIFGGLRVALFAH